MVGNLYFFSSLISEYEFLWITVEVWVNSKSRPDLKKNKLSLTYESDSIEIINIAPIFIDPKHNYLEIPKFWKTVTFGTASTMSTSGLYSSPNRSISSFMFKTKALSFCARFVACIFQWWQSIQIPEYFT